MSAAHRLHFFNSRCAIPLSRLELRLSFLHNSGLVRQWNRRQGDSNLEFAAASRPSRQVSPTGNGSRPMPQRESQLVARFAVRREDQRTVAVIALLLATLWLANWVRRGGWNGNLRHLDRSSHRIEFVLNVNRARWPELSALPRIGETLAKRIVESRRQEGPFRSVDDLQRVRGIGSRTVERIRPYVSFESPAARAVNGVAKE